MIIKVLKSKVLWLDIRMLVYVHKDKISLMSYTCYSAEYFKASHSYGQWHFLDRFLFTQSSISNVSNIHSKHREVKKPSHFSGINISWCFPRMPRVIITGKEKLEFLNETTNEHQQESPNQHGNMSHTRLSAVSLPENVKNVLRTFSQEPVDSSTEPQILVTLNLVYYLTCLLMY